MAFYGSYNYATSVGVESIDSVIYKLAAHHAPFLRKYLNLTPAGTQADPEVKGATHNWVEKPLKSMRDKVHTAIAASATTLYTANEFARYIAGKTVILVGQEYMTVSAVGSYGSGKRALTVARGFNSSTDAAHNPGDNIQIMNITPEAWVVDRSDAQFAEKKYNVCQILSRAISLSGTAQATKTYGNEFNFDVQAAELIPEMFQELENLLISGTYYSSTTDRMMGGMKYYVQSAMKFDNAGNKLTLATLDADLDALRNVGVDTNKLSILCGQNVRAALSNQKALTVTDAYNNKKLDFGVTMIMTPQGYRLPIDPDPVGDSLNPDEYFLFPGDSIQVKFLRKLVREKLAKVGDSDEEFLVMEPTAEFKGWSNNGALWRYGIK